MSIGYHNCIYRSRKSEKAEQMSRRGPEQRTVTKGPKLGIFWFCIAVVAMAPARPHPLGVILLISFVHTIRQVVVDVCVEDGLQSEAGRW
jgi:hypothetical protein